MSSTHFFNFKNEETYHFFQWVVHSEQVKYEILIARAFEEVSTSKTSDIGWKMCLPTHCLSPGGPGPNFLKASNSRIWLDSGRSFSQISLTQYFQGLHMLLNPQTDAHEQQIEDSRVFIPLRSFRPECLLTERGESILEKLLVNCALVVIDDADLRPQDLQSHRVRTSLSNVTAIDMTKALGLKGRFCYALLRANDSAVNHLNGQQLW